MTPTTLATVNVLFVLSFLIECVLCVKYVGCPPKQGEETRKLFVATCDTRFGWKSHWALRAWNTTGHKLRERDGLSMINVCYDKSWQAHGFLTKPILYKKFMLGLPADSYVILMDSDTFWSAENLKSIWHKFDCARGNKEVVLSTEMQCWVGRYCTAADLERWYKNLADTPSYSPFANSGIVMGRTDLVIDMLKYVIQHNKEYFTEKPGNKYKFDDQYAIADYAISIKPELVALDYHQQLLASFSVHAPQTGPHFDPNWGFVCKRKNGTFSMNCPDYTMRLNRQGFFHLDPDTCHLTRRIKPYTDLGDYVETLSPSPVIWHGNGVGKRIYIPLSDNVFRCEIGKRGMTYQQYQALV